MPGSDKALTGAAGVFHVASVFSMRGMIALPTIRNTAGYDIVVSSPDGLKHANIQVKTSAGRPKFWPVCQNLASVKTSSTDFYVLLRRSTDNSGFEGFMLSSGEMKAELEGDLAYRAARNQQPDKFSLCASLGDEVKNDRWREMWKVWTL
jgi:hypothetical protein